VRSLSADGTEMGQKQWAPNFSGLAAVVDASNHERLTSAKQMRQRLFGLRLNF
jgi:hypothetical protein